MMTLLFLLFTMIEVNAQMITKKEAVETILKDMVGLEYDSPVVGDMGYKKIVKANIDSKDMFSFQDKAGKDLFWFNIERTSIEYKNDALSIWYGYYNYKVKCNRNIGIKIENTFKSLKKMGENRVETMPSKKYDDVDSFKEGFAIVSLNEKYGFIDQQGKEVIPLKYDDVFSFSEGLARVKLNGKFGFVDQKGKEIIPLKYEHAYFFGEGLVAVKLNGKYGFIDKNGKEVIPLKYDDATIFSGGLATVQLNGKYGSIDKTEKVVIPFKYENSYYFSNGRAAVKLNGGRMYIDKTGKVVE